MCTRTAHEADKQPVCLHQAHRLALCTALLISPHCSARAVTSRGHRTLPADAQKSGCARGTSAARVSLASGRAGTLISATAHTWPHSGGQPRRAVSATAHVPRRLRGWSNRAVRLPHVRQRRRTLGRGTSTCCAQTIADKAMGLHCGNKVPQRTKTQTRPQSGAGRQGSCRRAARPATSSRKSISSLAPGRRQTRPSARVACTRRGGSWPTAHRPCGAHVPGCRPHSTPRANTETRPRCTRAVRRLSASSSPSRFQRLSWPRGRTCTAVHSATSTKLNLPGSTPAPRRGGSFFSCCHCPRHSTAQPAPAQLAGIQATLALTGLPARQVCWLFVRASVTSMGDTT